MAYPTPQELSTAHAVVDATNKPFETTCYNCVPFACARHQAELDKALAAAKDVIKRAGQRHLDGISSFLAHHG